MAVSPHIISSVGRLGMEYAVCGDYQPDFVPNGQGQAVTSSKVDENNPE